MDQSSNIPVIDPVKKRREYLRSKWLAYAGLILVCILGGSTVLAISGAAIGFVVLTTTPNSAFRHLGTGLIIAIPTLVLMGYVNAYKSQVKKARAIPYVPPVAEQISSLPSDEILLRGSDQPAATPEQLLRAAERAGMETAPEELLRPSD